MPRPGPDQSGRYLDLINEADSLCSLILYRESHGLSDQTRRDLAELCGKLRRVTDPR